MEILTSAFAFGSNICAGDRNVPRLLIHDSDVTHGMTYVIYHARVSTGIELYLLFALFSFFLTNIHV